VAIREEFSWPEMHDRDWVEVIGSKLVRSTFGPDGPQLRQAAIEAVYTPFRSECDL
jgi:hypothetical protein